MVSFTGLWKRKNFNFARDYYNQTQPELLNFIESGQFHRREVKIGDFIYAVSTNDRGELLLIGKMQVGKIVSSAEEVEDILGLEYEVYSGEEENQQIDYAIAEFGTIMQFDMIIPYATARNLRFVTKKGLTSLTFQPGTKNLDGQTLRTMRVLTRESATKLDKFLKSGLSKVNWYLSDES